jgi:plastocyanin
MKRKHIYLAIGIVMTGLSLMYGCSKTSSSNTGNTGSTGNNGNNGNSATGTAVSISNYAFVPDTLHVTAGQTVTWTNADAVAHTVTATNAAWNSGNVAPGATYQYTFPTAGTFTYHCTIHPMMKTAVIVVSGASTSGNSGY